MEFRQNPDHLDDFPEEHPDVPVACYGSLGAVAAQEGESVGSGMKDATLADCKRACNSQEMSEVLIKIACVPGESNELLTWGWVNIDNIISHIIYILYYI